MNARRKPNAAVLVVDDEQIVHESVRRVLEEGGFRVASALRVDQALGELEKGTFDLTLTDLMMPERSGMEVVETIAQKYPDIGVIMFTGYATVDSAVESMKLGALDYLPKPFTPDELLKVTNRALEKVLKARRDREIEKTYAEAERALRSSLDLKEILNLICSSVVRLFSVKAGAVFIFRKRDETFVLASSCGLSEEYAQKGLIDARQSISEVMEFGKPVIVEDADFETGLQYPAEARRENINFIVSIPMKLEENVLGVLRIYDSEKRSFSVDEMDLLLKFAEQAARALENAMRYERVRSDIEGLKKFMPKTP